MQEYEYTRRMMGTNAVVSIVAATKEAADESTAHAFATILSYEQEFSRFLPETALSQLNTKKDMIVSERFFVVLARARELFIETKGVFNPLVQVARLGYTKSFDTLGDEVDMSIESPYDIDFTTIDMNPATRRVVLADGQQLDFGGFLKGYVAEEVAKTIEQTCVGCTGVIVNIGGDLHTRGVDANGMPFVFEIENPVTSSCVSLPIQNASLATSGSYKRRWNTPRGTYHHLLNAHGDGNPVTDVVSASVVHESGSTAEAYTKVLFTVAREHIADVCPKLGAITYVLITNTGETITHNA